VEDLDVMKDGNLRDVNVIVILLLLFTTGSLADVNKVPSDYSTIQAAIDASMDGDIVLVAPGTYIGDGNRNIDFKGKALTVRSTDPNNLEIVQKTIIDCQGTEEDTHRGFQFISGEGRDSILAGFKIINGSGSEIKVSDLYSSVVGGAVLCLDSSPTIFGCVIDRNFAGSSGRGGGIYCFNSSAVITKCIIQYNKAYAGGGIFCNSGSVVIDQSTFNSNSSRYSGVGSGVTFSFRYCTVFFQRYSNCKSSNSFFVSCFRIKSSNYIAQKRGWRIRK